MIAPRFAAGFTKNWLAATLPQAASDEIRSTRLLAGPRRRAMLCALSLGLAFCDSAEARLILVGHRGVAAHAPENTLASFNRAKAVADFVEFDVWPTKDGQLVVIHDSTVDRTTNGKGAISEFTLAQIRELDAGSWFDKAFAGEKIPTADETIAAIQTEAAPFMERKEGTVEQFVALLSRQPLRPEGIVMSFDYSFVTALKKAKPDVQVGWLGSGTLTSAQITQAISEGISHFVWSNSDVTPAMVNTIHQAGALVFAWTVDDLGTVDALSERGVDGIITDLSDDFATAPAFSSPFSTDQVQPLNRMAVRLGGAAVLAAAAPRETARLVEWRRANETGVLGTGSHFMLKADNAQSYGRYVASWMHNGESVSLSYDLSAGVADNQLVNISARMTMGTGEATGIVGFVVKSAHAPRFLIRAIGPTLASLGVVDPVSEPSLTLFHRSTVIDSDSIGSRVLADGADFDRNGAFPLVAMSNDVAIMKDLEGGAYTVHLSSADNKVGVGLIEVYQDNTEANWALGAPINISLRGRAIPGSPLIGGFVVPAGSSQTVLVRGIGPSLARFGITEPLRDPTLRIYNSNHTLVAENDDWWADGDSAVIQNLATEVGAFRIGTGREAAILVTLAPGAYSAVLSDASASREGIGLLEIYAVSPESTAAQSF